MRAPCGGRFSSVPEAGRSAASGMSGPAGRQGTGAGAPVSKQGTSAAAERSPARCGQPQRRWRDLSSPRISRRRSVRWRAASAATAIRRASERRRRGAPRPSSWQRRCRSYTEHEDTYASQEWTHARIAPRVGGCSDLSHAPAQRLAADGVPAARRGRSRAARTRSSSTVGSNGLRRTGTMASPRPTRANPAGA